MYSSDGNAIIAIDGQEKDFYIRQLWDSEGLGRGGNDDSVRHRNLRHDLRLDAGKGSCPLGIRSRSVPYLGGGDVFDQALAVFAESYADQNERDYQALQQGVSSGRIKAETGV